MLGKLMKYEFKATARIFLPVYAILLALCAIFRLCSNVSSIRDQGWLLAIGIILLVIAFTAVGVVTLVLIISRFWTNLLGREGYLMHTLPVSSWQHILGKMFTSLVWCVASILVYAAAVLLLVATVADMNEAFRSVFGEQFRFLLDEVRAAGLTGALVRFGIELLVLLLFSGCGSILLMYLSMCIGQMANKHRIWASISSFIGINIVVSWLSNLLNLSNLHVESTGGSLYVYTSGIFHTTVTLSNETTPRELMSLVNNQLLISLAISLVLVLVYFFVTNFLLGKRLNLK